MERAGARIAAARQKIADLEESLGLLGPAPSDVSTMLDSANLRRQADHLERAGRIKSEAISAYAEYAGVLEDALREIAGAQRELAAMARSREPPRRGAARPAPKARRKKQKAPRRPPAKPARAKKAAKRRPAAGRKKAPRVSRASPRRRR